jgi:hypothetical protein
MDNSTMAGRFSRRRDAAPEAKANTTPGAPFPERRAGMLALALVVLATVRIAATYTVFSHTWDEPPQIACGMEWLDHGTYWYEADHPPLARVATAIGPYLMGVRAQHTPLELPNAPIIEGLGILYDGKPYDRVLSAARAGILPFFWLACAVVWWWGLRYFGRLEAVTAVFLFTFLEPVLAHAGLATTDMALTAWLGAAFLSGAVWLEQPTAGRAALFGLCAGLAVVSKYSSLPFFAASAAIALAWYAALERPDGKTMRAGISRRLPGLALAAAVVCAVIVATFRFSFGHVHGWKLPAPEFFRGIHEVLLHNARGQNSYLLGKRSHSGFRFYYQVVLAVKTPLAFLFLTAAGVLPAVRRRGGYRLGWLPLAFAAGILAVAFFSRINIGVRHILPVYTGLSLTASAGAIHLWRTGARQAWARYALAAALLWFGGTSLAAHPDYLPYFNELAGGHPENILVDSDLDWGQDAKRLAARLRELGADQVAFRPFAIMHPHRHGFPTVIPLDPASPHYGWNATGASTWKEERLGLYDKRPELNPLWPDRFAPVERVGKSIWLWYFPPPGAGR